MPYDINTPRPSDLPSDSQEELLENFHVLPQIYGKDHIPFGDSISAATSANPCVVTVPNHNFVNGDILTINNLKGTNLENQIESWSVNGQSSAITVSGDDITLSTIDSSNEPPYIENTGDVYAAAKTNFYGTHKKLTFFDAFPFPNLGNPYLSIALQQAERYVYTGEPPVPTQPSLIDVLDLFFQNTATSTQRLTGSALKPFYIPNKTFIQRGIVTPWNVIINFGTNINITTSPETIEFPDEFKYKTTHYFTVATQTFVGGQPFISNTTLNGFDVTQTGGSRSFSYMSWGV